MKRSAVWRLLFGEYDAVIDGLITANRATARPNMEAVDWRKVERLGARRWHETVRGQKAGRVVPFSREA